MISRLFAWLPIYMIGQKASLSALLVWAKYHLSFLVVLGFYFFRVGPIHSCFVFIQFSNKTNTYLFFPFWEKSEWKYIYGLEKETNTVNIQQYDCWKGVSEMTSE